MPQETQNGGSGTISLFVWDTESFNDPIFNRLLQVRDAKSACDAWKRLADTFEGKGLYRKVLLLRQLYRVEYGQFSTVS
ncbi:gag-polypeptide of LTR copia-type domain-containing protein [Phthorimaea operculella]|nr:gag-polypeptide of LTR copia-type domain-containing protein [Phthorimaea operculella]